MNQSKDNYSKNLRLSNNMITYNCYNAVRFIWWTLSYSTPANPSIMRRRCCTSEYL